MKDTLTLLKERRSMRSYDSGRLILDSDKEIIFNAALQAPTAGNMTLYSIIDIQSDDLKSRLAKLCDHQIFIASAPMVLVFAADYSRWYEIFKENDPDTRKPAEGDLMLAMDDALIAAENAVTAAEALGISSCYIGDILENYEQVRELLKLPKYAVPACMLCFGYPSESAAKQKKPGRFKIEDIVSKDTYHHSDMKRMIAERNQINDTDELKQWITAFRKRKWDSDFSKEMSRSIKAMILDWDE